MCEWVAGDAMGGTEEIMGDVETKQGCLNFVQSLRPNANAATYSAQGACYAEFNATYINSGLYNCSWCPTYQSCLLHIDEKPLSSPPPESSSDEPSADILILGAAGIFFLMLVAGVTACVVWKRHEELKQHEASLPEILPTEPEWKPTVVDWITGKAQQREKERQQEELRLQEKEEQRLREAEQWKEEELHRIQEMEQRVQEGWAQRAADDQRQREEARQQQAEENRKEVAERWEEYKQFRRKQVQNAEMQVEQMRGRETDSRRTIRLRLGNEHALRDMVLEGEEWEAHRGEEMMAQFHREAAQLEFERAQRKVDHARAELHEQMAHQPGRLNVPDFPDR